MEKKHFSQSSDKFGYSFIKNDIMFMYIYFVFTKNRIILRLFKIDTLNFTIRLFKIDTFNFTIHILTISASSLKIYVIGLHNLISMNLLYNCKKDDLKQINY